MAVFSQWNRSRPLRQITWVCGPERVLRNMVVAHYMTSFPDLPKAILWIGAIDESQTWDYLLATPPERGRLVIVRAAEDIRLAERLPLLVQTLPDLSRVVFVSAEEDFARSGQPHGKRQAGPEPLAPHLAAIQGHKEGQLIRCCRPSREEELLKLIASWWPGAGANWAAQVWERCFPDLTVAWQACDTARRAGLAPEVPEHLDMACQHLPGVAFADLVLAGKTAQALAEARKLGQQEALGALGMLNSRLAQVRSYAAMFARGLAPDEIAGKGISRFRQHDLAPHLSRYTPARELGCRRLLAVAEEALRSGARAGVLEAVASLWLWVTPISRITGMSSGTWCVYRPDWITWRVSTQDDEEGYAELAKQVSDCGLEGDSRVRLRQIPPSYHWYLEVLVPVLKGEHVTPELAAGHQATLGEGAVVVLAGSADEAVLQSEARQRKDSLLR